MRGEGTPPGRISADIAEIILVPVVRGHFALLTLFDPSLELLSVKPIGDPLQFHIRFARPGNVQKVLSLFVTHCGAQPDSIGRLDDWCLVVPYQELSYFKGDMIELVTNLMLQRYPALQHAWIATNELKTILANPNLEAFQYSLSGPPVISLFKSILSEVTAPRITALQIIKTVCEAAGQHFAEVGLCLQTLLSVHSAAHEHLTFHLPPYSRHPVGRWLIWSLEQIRSRLYASLSRFTISRHDLALIIAEYYARRPISLFHRPGPELPALQALLGSNPEKLFFTYCEIERVIAEGSLHMGGKKHRMHLLCNPELAEEDDTGVSNVVRAVGRVIEQNGLIRQTPAYTF